MTVKIFPVFSATPGLDTRRQIDHRPALTSQQAFLRLLAHPFGARHGSRSGCSLTTGADLRNSRLADPGVDRIREPTVASQHPTAHIITSPNHPTRPVGHRLPIPHVLRQIKWRRTRERHRRRLPSRSSAFSRRNPAVNLVFSSSMEHAPRFSNRQANFDTSANTPMGTPRPPRQTAPQRLTQHTSDQPNGRTNTPSPRWHRALALTAWDFLSRRGTTKLSLHRRR